MSYMELGIVKTSNILPERDKLEAELRAEFSGTKISMAVFTPSAVLCADHINSARFLDLLIGISRKNVVWIVTGSMVWEERGDRSFRTFILNDGGEVAGSYERCHLAYYHESIKDLRIGNKPFIFPYGGILFSLADIPDLLHPEFFRVLALSGAEAVIVSSHDTLDEFTAENLDIFCRARAIENQMYIIAPLGSKTDSVEAGRETLAFDPTGQIIRAERLSTNIEKIGIDSSHVSRDRKRINILGCRNRKVYHPLTEL